MPAPTASKTKGTKDSHGFMYEVKRVRAVSRGWDGFRVREPEFYDPVKGIASRPADEFVMRIYTHNAAGQKMAPPSWVEILDDATEDQIQRLVQVVHDPAALPPRTMPPLNAALQGATNADGGVL